MSYWAISDHRHLIKFDANLFGLFLYFSKTELYEEPVTYTSHSYQSIVHETQRIYGFLNHYRK